MTRQDLIKKAGIGLTSGPFNLKGGSYFQTRSLLKARPLPFHCVLTPRTSGEPFYLDPAYHRKNIKEGRVGLPLKLKVNVLEVSNYEPISDAVVNIWHCDARGVYSESGRVAGHSEASWLRGYQFTDAAGYCEFETIFPGWYPGRATHLHFDLHRGFEAGSKVGDVLNSTASFHSHMYLPNSVKSRVYAEHPAYAENGDNSTDLDNDRLYQNAGASEALMLQFDEGDYPNALSASFTIGLDMAALPTKAQNQEGRQHFRLHENAPDPFSDTTHINFSMFSPGTVTLSVFNADGEVAAQLMRRQLGRGDYTVEFSRGSRDYYLHSGIYVFDMIVDTRVGRFRQSRKMLII